jgi:NADH-quinone oxidoreductase subunit M
MTAFLQQPVTLIVIILLIGLSLSLALPAGREDVIRSFSLKTSFVVLIIGLLSCLSFNKTMAGFQFMSRLDLLPQYNLSFTLGADGISVVFLLLTLFIFPVCFLSAWTVAKQMKQFFNYLLAMELLLVLAFGALDIFYFYVFFESLLIPMFILIGV